MRPPFDGEMVIVSASRKPPLAVCEVTVVVVEPVVTFPRRAAASINANGPSVGTAGAWPYSTLDSAGESPDSRCVNLRGGRRNYLVAVCHPAHLRLSPAR